MNITTRQRVKLGAIVQRSTSLSKVVSLLDQMRSTQGTGWGPLNSQAIRMSIFHEVFQKLSPNVIIETGTYRGDSTDYFARTYSSTPVISIELNRRAFHFAERRLRPLVNADIRLGSSVDHLPAIMGQHACSLLYLDAHWEEHLPLSDELVIAADSARDWVAIVDDFFVPGDSGYSGDDYGPGRRLDHDYLKAVPRELFVWWPRAASSMETGPRRGTAIVTSRESVATVLDSIESLRRA